MEKHPSWQLGIDEFKRLLIDGFKKQGQAFDFDAEIQKNNKSHTIFENVLWIQFPPPTLVGNFGSLLINFLRSHFYDEYMKMGGFKIDAKKAFIIQTEFVDVCFRDDIMKSYRIEPFLAYLCHMMLGSTLYL